MYTNEIILDSLAAFKFHVYVAYRQRTYVHIYRACGDRMLYTGFSLSVRVFEKARVSQAVGGKLNHNKITNLINEGPLSASTLHVLE